MIEYVRLRQFPYVAVLSLALVAMLELVQAGILLAMNQPIAFPDLVRDLILKVPWSILICVAVWSGLALGRGSAVIATLVAGVSAPTASLIAHALAEMAALYTMSAAHEMLVSPYLVAAQKGVAYVALALLVLWLWTRTRATAWQHAAAGLAVGLLFGGALLLVEAEWGLRPVTASVLVAWAVNEVLFPIGCALLLCHVRGRVLIADHKHGVLEPVAHFGRRRNRRASAIGRVAVLSRRRSADRRWRYAS
jgi:hypothetical protein